MHITVPKHFQEVDKQTFDEFFSGIDYRRDAYSNGENIIVRGHMLPVAVHLTEGDHYYIDPHYTGFYT